MIVHNFYVIGVPLEPDKTETPLIIDPNTVLSLPLATQCFQAITRRCREVAQFRCIVQLPKLASGNGFD